MIEFTSLPRDIHSQLCGFLSFSSITKVMSCSKTLNVLYKSLYSYKKSFLTAKLRKHAKYNLVKSYCNKLSPIIYPYEKRIKKRIVLLEDQNFSHHNIHVVQSAIIYLPRLANHNVEVFCENSSTRVGHGIRVSLILDHYCLPLTIIFVEMETYIHCFHLFLTTFAFTVGVGIHYINPVKTVLHGFDIEGAVVNPEVNQNIVLPCKSYNKSEQHCWNFIKTIYSGCSYLYISSYQYESLKYVSTFNPVIRRFGNLRTRPWWYKEFVNVKRCGKTIVNDPH
jgi:hypothetical protein